MGSRNSRLRVLGLGKLSPFFFEVVATDFVSLFSLFKCWARAVRVETSARFGVQGSEFIGLRD